MNHDGAVTISDVGLWLKWLFFMPGDAVMLAIMDTPVGHFFEITPSSYYGVASGTISVVVWLYLLRVVGANLLSPLAQTNSQRLFQEPKRESRKERIARERRENQAKPWWARNHDTWVIVGAVVAFAIIFLIYAIKGWL